MDAARLRNADFHEPALLGSGLGNAGFDRAGWGVAFYDEGLGCDDAILGEIDPSTGLHFLSIYDMITLTTSSPIAQIVLMVACVRAIAACLR